MTTVDRNGLPPMANSGGPAFELVDGERFWASAIYDLLLGLRLCIPFPILGPMLNPKYSPMFGPVLGPMLGTRPERFSGDPRVLPLALALALSLTAFVDYAVEMSHGHGALAFNHGGLYATATWLFAATALLFLLAMANASLHRLGEMLTGVLVVEMLRTMAAGNADLHAATFASAIGAPLGPLVDDFAASAVTLYFTVAAMHVVYLSLEVTGLRRLVVVAAAGAGLWATSAAVPESRLFGEAAIAKLPPLDIEATYVKQEDLVKAALDRVRPSRPGVVDTYFVGFASFSAQDVFANEARHVEALFQRSLDAEGRTALLVNSRDALDSLPLANGHNLGAVLRGISAKMDREDLLYLHMTSHGSTAHEFSVSFENLGLNDLSAADIGRIVNEADLPWRIIVVSACYSGGYIDALKSPTTLVMTASDAKKASFGCEHGREFTYFGKALYQDNLADSDYPAAFQRAVEAVTLREEQEGLEPSEPQIWVGAAIADKLASG